MSIRSIRRIPLQNRGVSIPRHPTTLGGHLKRRRAQLRLGQSQVFYLLGVSTVTLSHWECDKVTPAGRYHPAITQYLGRYPGR
jgi:DNA-binding transcriptional regulator YiaG